MLPTNMELVSCFIILIGAICIALKLLTLWAEVNYREEYRHQSGFSDVSEWGDKKCRK